MKKHILCAAFVSGLLSFGEAEAKKQADKPVITVHKSPTCGCCGKWEDHLKANGFEVKSNPREDMAALKAEQGIPKKLHSCHTGIVNGYVVEGHVPAATVKKLLAQKPKGVKGIAVPGMPIGSPGMEGPNPEKYDVLSFGTTGEPKVFDRY